MEIPRDIVPASKMKKNDWVFYQWEDVRTVTDIEPMYLCCGIRDIEKAKEAAENWEVWKASFLRTKGK